ncbi:MAG: hypothetical protein H0U23_01905 [Blastocatellia bacterium]|nr:hypothetical protein [Blastocatellia bacterium]
MTQAKRKAKEALRDLSMTFADLAVQADLALSTVHSVLSEETGSRKSKQAITDALGVEIWPGVVPSGGFSILPAGTEIESPDLAMAKKFAAECEAEMPGCTRRTGRVVTLLKTVTFTRGNPQHNDFGKTGAGAPNSRTHKTEKEASGISVAATGAPRNQHARKGESE